MSNRETFYAPPSAARALRACLSCSIVLTSGRFQRDGCPNCEEFLMLAGSAEAVQDCTSQVFEGLITMADPKSSWVARWQRIDGYVPGTYAVKVVGMLPDEAIASLESAGIRYIPRDGSAQVEQA